MAYPRPCEKCGNKFQPHTPFNKLCEECWKKSHINRKRTHKKIEVFI